MGKRRKRRRRKSSALAGAAETIYERLEKIHLELLRRRSAEPKTVRLELPLAVELHTEDKKGAVRDFTEKLLGALEREVEESIAASSPFLRGRVYCFWCESAGCQHAEPPAPRMVFAGYNPTGIPLWEDFVSLCLRLRDSRIDRLYRTPPVPFSVSLSGSALTRDQLTVFGARSRLFRILSQTMVGYVSIDGSRVLDRLAVTLQVVSGAGPDGKSRLHLNVVGKTETGEDVWRAVAALPDQRLSDLFDKGARKLRSLSTQRAGPSRNEAVAGVLKHVAAGVEKICRQETRRTKHARLRHRDRSRPTGAALRDCKNAKAEDFLLDRRRRTVIVLGPHARAHVFNPEGRHVTSLVLKQEELDRRLHTRQWVPLEEEKRGELRERILSGGMEK